MSLSFSYAILEWARTKPADEAYDYCNPANCLVAQFGIETGRSSLTNLSADELQQRFPIVSEAVHPRDCGPWTFGAFAKRLEEALA